jgi:hypothetical protein
MKKIILLLHLFMTVFQVKAQDISRIRKHIDTLCSPAMSGRGYVQGGDSIAAKYISEQFTAFQLQHWNNDYYQSFVMPINTFPLGANLQVGNKKLQLGINFLPKTTSGSGSGEAPILHLDSAIFSNQAKAKKFLNKNISKYALVVRQKDYPKLVGMPDAYLKKVYQAQVVIELTEKNLVASLSDYRQDLPIFEVKANSFDMKAKKAIWQVKSDFKHKHIANNIIGYVKGTAQPDSFLVFTAHYDHVGRMGNVYFPGANDNASGTALLLELAQYYAQNPAKYSVVFMAFAAEEAGLLGSRFFCDSPLFPLRKIKFLTNLDLLGTGDGLMVVNATVFPTYFDKLNEINQEKNYVKQLRKRGKAANSDHYFFTEKGVPSFYVYTLAPGAGYHDIYDKPETLSLEDVQNVFRLLTDFYSSF